VIAARATTALPYFRADIRREVAGGEHTFAANRLRPGRPGRFEAKWEVGRELGPAGRFLYLRVSHAPWQLAEATVEHLEETVTAAARLDALTPAEPFAQYSSGVDVSFLPPQLLSAM
jgi:uncharacterized protein YqjF (DUF2071 family)